MRHVDFCRKTRGFPADRTDAAGTTKRKEGDAMSTTYLLYLEKRVRENGAERWKCVDGYHKAIPYGKTEEAMRLSTLLSNGSRTCFGETYDQLAEIGTWAPFDELSREIREAHPSLAFEKPPYAKEKKPALCLTVPKRDFDACAPKGFQYHRVCHKDAIAAYEAGEAEEPWSGESPDLSAMDEESRKCWSYYEWDSPYGWRRWFKAIAERIRWEETRYAENVTDLYDGEERIVVFRL